MVNFAKLKNWNLKFLLNFFYRISFFLINIVSEQFFYIGWENWSVLPYGIVAKKFTIPKNFDRFPNNFYFVTIFPFDELSLTFLSQKKSISYSFFFCMVTKNCYQWYFGIGWFQQKNLNIGNILASVGKFNS